MQILLSFAIIIALLSCGLILLRYTKLKLVGDNPLNLFAFIAILYTSGLDVGLVMLPLTEFPTYAGTGLAANEPNPYGFASPLAISFGFWGGLIWAFYFLTTFYFCVLEPKVKLFQKPLIKTLNNIVIVATCAFTGYIFLINLPVYIVGIPIFWQYFVVATVALLAVLSSTHIRYIKVLSKTSTLAFLLLILSAWLLSGASLTELGMSASNLGDYLTTLPHFIMPVSDYHAFYLFWWFSWSIMIGQFVARFVGNMETWKLFLALIIFPSIPIALWFSVLYIYYQQNLQISASLNIFMIVVGVMFVINSLDSLTRLYSENLNLTVEKLGRRVYVVLHWLLIFGLILLYQFTPLKIEWIGTIVTIIYAMVYVLLIKQPKAFKELLSNQ